MSIRDCITAYCPYCEQLSRLNSYVSLTGEQIQTADGSADAYVCDDCGSEIYISNAPED